MVHLLTGLLPRRAFRHPKVLLTAEECASAVAALKEAEGVINVQTQMGEALAALSDPKHARDARKIFIEAGDKYRLTLQGHSVKEPLRRLDLHQVAMATQFYTRGIESLGTPVSDPVAGVVQYYNYDIRRDRIITKDVHDYVLVHREASKEQEETVKSLLLLERKLFGQTRLHAKHGQGEQHLCLGVPFRDVKTEKELLRILALPLIKEHGNFVQEYDDPDPELKDAHRQRWKHAVVNCAPEPEAAEVLDQTQYQPVESNEWRLRILKKAPPVPFWGRVRQKALDVWVMLFTFWAMFFLVDEEIITFIGLIYTKYKQTQLLKEEARKAGGDKVYVAKNRGF